MPLPNARINKLKNISRRLFEDTQDDREEDKKRSCQGIQTERVHVQNANEDIDSSHNLGCNVVSTQDITLIDRQEAEQVTYYLV